MLRAAFTLATLLTASAVYGCATQSQAPVPVQAQSADLSALVGEWTGEYSSAATGRSGSIVFTLAAGRDTAFGDVVMVPRGASDPLVPDPRAGGAGTVVAPSAGRGLTIRFVRLTGDSVSGVLDPYRAPDCNCVLTTTFAGRVRDDRIEGTYTTRGEASGSPQTGRWEVTRRKR